MIKRYFIQAVLLALILVLELPAIANAAFNKNSIISDAVFNASSSMSAADIDSWINAHYGSTSCISTMHGFKAPQPIGRTSDGNWFHYGGDVSAGTIIYNISHVFGISPKVILTTLEKEENLVSGSNGCSLLRYTSSMGYGCPDSGGSYNYSGFELYSINGTAVKKVNGTCVNLPDYAGFSRQVAFAGWQFEYNMQRSEGNVNWAPSLNNFPANGDSWSDSDVPSSPNFCYFGYMTPGNRASGGAGSGCTTIVHYSGVYTIDSTSVSMSTGADASLYRYTPHISGNQSFYNLYVNWFGNTYAAPIRMKIIDASSTKSGGSAVVEYYLISAPSSNVTIPLALNDPTGGSTDQASFNSSSSVVASNLIITPSSWSSASSNKVTIYGRSDGLADGDLPYILIAGTTTSSDPSYSNLNAPNASLVNQDNLHDDIGLAGDWDGNGKTDIGVKRGQAYFLSYKFGGVSMSNFSFGRWNDTAIAGDWNGDGKSDIGIKRGNTYYLEYKNGGAAAASFSYGQPTDIPIAGDWNGDGKWTISLYRPSTKQFFLNNSLKDHSDASFSFGASGDTPLAGDWNGDGKWTVGLYRPSTRQFFLANQNKPQADITFTFGATGDTPLKFRCCASLLWDKMLTSICAPEL